ncbi:uncharacterized protein HaLaN_13202, partial [Haematococcus lacustris]
AGAGRRVECFDQYDPAVVAATKARLLADAEKRAAAAGGGDGTGEEGDILADTLMSVVVDRGESEQTSAPMLLERRKGETAEEKKARKAAVKEVRRANRASKKQLKAMFKEEFSKQKKQAAGSSGTCGGSTFIIP